LGIWHIVTLEFSVAALARCGLCGSGGEKYFQLFIQDSNLKKTMILEIPNALSGSDLIAVKPVKT
jgi:hypothetical protein